jgi:hypothetical protein
MTVCTFVASLLLIAAQGATPGVNQHPLGRADLALTVRWVASSYGHPMTFGQGLVLQGEPIELEVWLIDRGLGPRMGAEADWFDRIELNITEGGMFGPAGRNLGPVRCLDTPGVKRTQGYIDLGKARRASHVCRIDLEKYDIAPGKYTAWVRWDERALSRQVRDLPLPRRPAPVEFEYREVASDADALDLTLHLAWRALMHDGQPGNAVRLSDAVLQREASSIDALVTRAMAFEALGRCQPARLDWMQAAESIEGFRDTGNRKYQEMHEEDRRALATKWRGKARGAGC